MVFSEQLFEGLRGIHKIGPPIRRDVKTPILQQGISTPRQEQLGLALAGRPGRFCAGV